MTARQPPTLIVRVPLSGEPEVVVHAATFEDEEALRSALLRSPIVGRLPVLVRRLLLDLDSRDREAAA